MTIKKLNRTPPSRGFFMERKKRILYIEAHPDDLAYTGAGQVKKWANKGYQVDSLIMTDGNFEGIGKKRIREQKKMMGLLGMSVLHAVGQDPKLKLKDFGLKDVEMSLMVNAILTIIKQAEVEGNPYDIFVSFGQDGYTGHPDHIILAEATRQAFNDKKNHTVKELWQVGMSEKERKLWGNYFVPIPKNKLKGYRKINIKDTFEDKIRAIEAHKSQNKIIGGGGGSAHIDRLKQLPKVEWFKVYRRK